MPVKNKTNLGLAPGIPYITYFIYISKRDFYYGYCGDLKAIFSVLSRFYSFLLILSEI